MYHNCGILQQCQNLLAIAVGKLLFSLVTRMCALSPFSFFFVETKSWILVKCYNVKLNI